MTGIDWTERLSEYLDGTLSAEERAACEAWLAASEDGRALLADLRKVVAKAKTLPDAPVPESVWAGVSAAIRKPDVAVIPIDSPTRRLAVSPSRRWQLSPLQLAAAAAILLALGVGIGTRIRSGVRVDVARNGTEAPGALRTVGLTAHADASYDKAVQELQALLAERRGDLDSTTVRVIETSLAKIDEALVEAERALAEDPGSEYLIDHLGRIKRKKLDLLRQSAALVQAS